MTLSPTLSQRATRLLLEAVASPSSSIPGKHSYGQSREPPVRNHFADLRLRRQVEDLSSDEHASKRRKVTAESTSLSEITSRIHGLVKAKLRHEGVEETAWYWYVYVPDCSISAPQGG